MAIELTGAHFRTLANMETSVGGVALGNEAMLDIVETLEKAGMVRFDRTDQPEMLPGRRALGRVYLLPDGKSALADWREGEVTLPEPRRKM